MKNSGALIAFERDLPNPMHKGSGRYRNGTQESVCSFGHRIRPEMLMLLSIRKVLHDNQVLFHWHFNFHSAAFSQAIEMSA